MCLGSATCPGFDLQVWANSGYDDASLHLLSHQLCQECFCLPTAAQLWFESAAADWCSSCCDTSLHQLVTPDYTMVLHWCTKSAFIVTAKCWCPSESLRPICKTYCSCHSQALKHDVFILVCGDAVLVFPLRTCYTLCYMKAHSSKPLHRSARSDACRRLAWVSIVLVPVCRCLVESTTFDSPMYPSWSRAFNYRKRSWHALIVSTVETYYLLVGKRNLTQVYCTENTVVA